MAGERKKAWDVEIPLMGYKVKALSTNQDGLIGKMLNLDLTRLLKGRGVEGNLVIRKEENKLVAGFVSIKVFPSYIKRMMRKNISWVEDSFSCKSKDGTILVKPFMITKKKVHRSVRAALRNKTKELIIEFAGERTAEQFFEAVLRDNFSKEISSRLKKVYPLAFFEIRILKILK